MVSGVPEPTRHQPQQQRVAIRHRYQCVQLLRRTVNG